MAGAENTKKPCLPAIATASAVCTAPIEEMQAQKNELNDLEYSHATDLNQNLGGHA